LAYSIAICRRFAEGSGWDFRTIPVTVMWTSRLYTTAKAGRCL